MRFFEFGSEDYSDRLVIILRNYIGRAASKKAPSKLNWGGLNQVLQSNGFELAADYETFKSIYDSNPAVQAMVKNFNDDGIELKVPGAPDEKNSPGTQDSQAEVDKAAASAAPAQLDQATATPQA